jgi:hypothetical protein
MGPENVALSGFELRTLQVVASRYTDYPIPASCSYEYNLSLMKI